jgi:hypothetical protein
MHSISSTITAILTSLSRPSTLITSMSTAQKAIDRHNLSVRRSDRWPLGLLDDARSRVQRDAQDKMDKSKLELADFGRELRYTQQVVAGELASWQENRVEMGRKALKDLAKKMVVVEKARLESMKRAVRALGIGISPAKNKDASNGMLTSGLVPPVGLDVAQAEIERGRLEHGPEEVEYANPIPRDDDEGQEVVHGNGQVAADELPPADEIEQEFELDGVGEVQGESEEEFGALQNAEEQSEPHSDVDANVAADASGTPQSKHFG